MDKKGHSSMKMAVGGTIDSMDGSFYVDDSDTGVLKLKPHGK